VRPGDAPEDGSDEDNTYAFQSAPGREAGRCRFCAAWSITDCAFQSAPGREAGRCHVSFGWLLQQLGFNPRPAVRPGDAAYDRHACPHLGVSIRARP